MNQDEIIALGTSLRRISQKLLKTDPDSHVTRIWYQGGEPYFDVFFDLQDNQVIWFQLTLRGQSLTWRKSQSGLETGCTHEINTDATKYPASKLIETDKTTNCDFLQIATGIMKTRVDETPFEQAVYILTHHGQFTINSYEL